MYTACIVAVNLKIGIAGLGAIGGVVARALENGLAGFELEAVSTRDAERPQSDPQLRIPLLVEVKASADDKQPVRRKRAKGVQRQPQLGKL